MIRKFLYWLADVINENRRLRARVEELLRANNEEVRKRREVESIGEFWRRDHSRLNVALSDARKAILDEQALRLSLDNVAPRVKRVSRTNIKN